MDAENNQEKSKQRQKNDAVAQKPKEKTKESAREY